MRPEEEPVVVAAFRMPLHAQPEWPFRILDGLDGAICRAGRGLEAGVGHHRLLVVTADLHTIAHECSHPGSFASGDGGPAECIPTRGMLLVTHDIRQVLFQRTARADCHDLHPPADPERGKTDSISGIEQSELPGVTITTHLGHGMGHLPVALGIHVGAASDDQAIEPGDHLCHAIVLRWQQHDDAAGGFDRSRVYRGQEIG